MSGAGTTAPSTFTHFYAHESTGGIVLGIATLAALLVGNSTLAGWYEDFLRMPGVLRMGADLVELEKPLLLWVNDLWMAVF